MPSNNPVQAFTNCGTFGTIAFSIPLAKSPAILLPNSITVLPALKNADTMALPIRTAPEDVMTS